MGSIQNPLGGPRDPYEGYRVEPVEGERHAKEDQDKKAEPQETPDKQSILLGYILTLLHKLFALFQTGPEKKKAPPAEEKEILETCRLLKAAFEMMKREELSQDIPFLNRLSELWQEILEHALRVDRSSNRGKEIRSLIDAIQRYPEKAPHSLGYYLSEYAGQKWLPFPYMEMIQKIHAEHLKNPPDSALTQWTAQIGKILSFFKTEAEEIADS